MIASNVDATEGAGTDLARRPSSARTSSPPATIAGRTLAEQFPKDGPIRVLVGVSAPGQNWAEQRAQRRHERAGGVQEGQPRPQDRHRPIDSGTDGAITADRVGAYLNAAPRHQRLFRHGPVAFRGRARADRIAASRRARSCWAASTSCPQVLQQMKAGYIQVADRPAAVRAGLHAGDGGLSERRSSVWRRPTSIPARRCHARPGRRRSWRSPSRACAELDRPLPAGRAAARRPPRRTAAARGAA